MDYSLFNTTSFFQYFSLVVFMFVVEFMLGSLAFIFRKDLGHRLIMELQDGLKHHYNITTSGPNSLVSIWDNLQSKFHCCGVINYEDWYMIDNWPYSNWVPDSCCKDIMAGCGRLRDPDLWYSGGCSGQIHMWFVQRLHIVGVVGLAVAFIQVRIEFSLWGNILPRPRCCKPR